VELHFGDHIYTDTTPSPREIGHVRRQRNQTITLLYLLIGAGQDTRRRSLIPHPLDRLIDSLELLDTGAGGSLDHNLAFEVEPRKRPD
jgi:hypothetical protein